MSDIVKQAFEDLPEFYSDNEKHGLVNELIYDIWFLSNQVRNCEYWIEEGNWIGYEENKKMRIERLKRDKKKLEELSLKLEQIKNDTDRRL